MPVKTADGALAGTMELDGAGVIEGNVADQLKPSVPEGSVADPFMPFVSNLVGYHWAPLPSDKIIAFYISVKESGDEIEIWFLNPKKKKVCVGNDQEMRELVGSILARHQKRSQTGMDSDGELSKTTGGLRAAIRETAKAVHHGRWPKSLDALETLTKVQESYLKAMPEAFVQNYGRFRVHVMYREASDQIRSTE